MTVKEETKKITNPANVRVEVGGGVRWTTSRVINLVISAQDNSNTGIEGYCISEGKINPADDSYRWVKIPQSYPLCTSYSGVVEFTLSPKDGMKEVYVWFKDGQGGISEPAQVNILLTSYEFIKRWGQVGKAEKEFIGPSAIALNPEGCFYIVDTDNHRIQKLDRDFNCMKQWGGKGKGEGKFSYPKGITVDPSGYIYVADSGNNCIQKFDGEGKFITQWGKTLKKEKDKWQLIDGNETDFSTKGGMEGEFYEPLSMTTDSEGNILIVDSGNHCIKKFDRDGKMLSVWGQNGSLDGMLHYPFGIAVDESQDIFISDMGNNRIQKFDRDGNFLSKWGKQGKGDGEFKLPSGIVIDSSQNIYVADAGNHRIQKFDKEGHFITSFGLTGGGDGEFNAPVFITIDHEGYIYILDKINATVQKFKYVPRT